MEISYNSPWNQIYKRKKKEQFTIRSKKNILQFKLQIPLMHQYKVLLQHNMEVAQVQRMN